MKTVSFINLKGGVGKTVSAINFAHILSTQNYRVLVVDNDQQGNLSSFFGIADPAHTIADIFTCHIRGPWAVPEIIYKTAYSGLDIIPADMSLLSANVTLAADTDPARDYRLRDALGTLRGLYDFIIIDNAPSINMSIVGALMASDDVMIPVRADRFSLDGLEFLTEQIENIRADNKNLRIAGYFFTACQNSTVNAQSETRLREISRYPVFETKIRSTVKIPETTYARVPISIYSPYCTAARDYKKLVAEYLQGVDVDG